MIHLSFNPHREALRLSQQAAEQGLVQQGLHPMPAVDEMQAAGMSTAAMRPGTLATTVYDRPLPAPLP